MRVPGRASPIADSSAAMAAARARWAGSGDTLPSSHAGCVHPVISYSINYCMTTAGGTAGDVARWGPPSVSPPAAAFARAAVARCGGLDRERAKNLLWAAGKLADHGIALGLQAEPAVLLHPSVIERFAAHSPGLSPSARRTLRTNLRFVARRVVPALRVPDAPLGRERAKPPYSQAEIAGFLALAAAQPTAGRRMHATALICLGAGAGLTGADLRAARGTDIVSRSGGVVAVVRGGRAPRPVPVLTGYHDRLLEAAQLARRPADLRRPRPEPAQRYLPASLPAGRRCRAAGPGHLPAALDLAGGRRGPDRPARVHARRRDHLSQRLGDITAGLDPGSEERDRRAARRPGPVRPRWAGPGLLPSKPSSTPPAPRP